jgi:hypothetical protein
MDISDEVNQRLLRHLLKKMIPQQHEFDDIDDCAGFIAFAIDQFMSIEASEEERKNIIDLMSNSIAMKYELSN